LDAEASLRVHRDTAGVLAAKFFGCDLKLRFSHTERDARSEPASYSEELVVITAVGLQFEGNPHVRRSPLSPAGRKSWAAEAGPQDPDHLIWTAAQGNGFPNDVEIAVEAPSPQFIAEDSDMAAPREIFRFGKRATDDQRSPKQPQKISADLTV
jgi:hypothetical protein